MDKKGHSEVQEVANTFIQVLEYKEYEKLGNVLEKQSYTSLDYTLEEVIDKYDRIFNGIKISNIHASKIEMEKVKNLGYELSYQLSFTTPLGKVENLNYKTKIDETDGKYLVKWDPSLIFPGMEGKDKVALHYKEAERGEIKDLFGNGLAVNEDFKWVGVVPLELGQGNEKDKNLQRISQQFEIPIEEINQKLNQNWVKDNLFVPLKIIESNKAEIMPGAAYQNIKLRYYPLKEAAAHLIGYIGKATKDDLDKNPNLSEGDMIGKAGLEKAFDKELRGNDGGEILIVDEQGNKKHEFQKVEKMDGDDILLTIDSYIQREAFKHLKGIAGSTVVMNPKEGGFMP
ncbi:NTF2-like N-terminal transpeptidase domain-containing protein [Mesobacillus boroniphilus]|nr:NTF2-like N-terminal transpeptidase domain-containing protein [Mesobacillus boroniphilus]